MGEEEDARGCNIGSDDVHWVTVRRASDDPPYKVQAEGVRAEGLYLAVSLALAGRSQWSSSHGCCTPTSEHALSPLHNFKAIRAESETNVLLFIRHAECADS